MVVSWAGRKAVRTAMQTAVRKETRTVARSADQSDQKRAVKSAVWLDFQSVGRSAGRKVAMLVSLLAATLALRKVALWAGELDDWKAVLLAFRLVAASVVRTVDLMDAPTAGKWDCAKADCSAVLLVTCLADWKAVQWARLMAAPTVVPRAEMSADGLAARTGARSAALWAETTGRDSAASLAEQRAE
jgi:hypothetical protein